MGRASIRRGALLSLASMAMSLNACFFKGTGSLFDVVWPNMTEEFYRIEATVCTSTERVEDERGVLVGLRFSIAKIGEGCDGQSRDVFVSSGRLKAMKRAEKVKINQRIAVTGVLAGTSKDNLIVREIVLSRR